MWRADNRITISRRLIDWKKSARQNSLLKSIRQTRLWVAAAVGLGILVVSVASHFLGGARYNGHSGDYWLRQTLSPNSVERIAGSQALQKMGPDADAAIIRGLGQKETMLFRMIKRMRWNSFGRRVYPKLPANMQSQINDYVVQGNAEALRWSAEMIVHNGHSRSIGPKMLPLLADTNQLTRAAVLGAMLQHIGADNVTSACLRPLSITARDSLPTIRLRTALCLAEAGPCAASELPTIRELCTDKNSDVRLAAAWSLERIEGGRAATELLRTALAEFLDHDGSVLSGWEIYSESPEFRMGSLIQTVVESCLTNTDATVRGNACLALIHDPRSARKDIPVVTRLLDDPDLKVRRHAASLLTSIQGSGP